MPMPEVYKVPLVLSPQSEGGYTVKSPILPELLTEGGTPEEALNNARDALAAVIEIYEDLVKPLPANLRQNPQGAPIWFEGILTRP